MATVKAGKCKVAGMYPSLTGLTTVGFLQVELFDFTDNQLRTKDDRWCHYTRRGESREVEGQLWVMHKGKFHLHICEWGSWWIITTSPSISPPSPWICPEIFQLSTDDKPWMAGPGLSAVSLCHITSHCHSFLPPLFAPSSCMTAQHNR